MLHSRDEGNALPANDGLFFTIFRKLAGADKPVQRTYRMPMLEDVVAATAGCSDTYIGQCSFFKFSRKTVHFKQARVAWVDLDLYNIDRQLNAATVAEILHHASSLGIPAPTAIVSSGRGCYLKWNFQVPITQYQLPIWQTLQAVLTAAFSSLAADTNARDASRVLRLLETKNSKSGKTVEVIDGCGVMYDFNSFCKTVEGLRLDLLKESAAQLSVLAAKKVAKKTTVLSKQIQGLGERGDMEALNLFTELRRPIMVKKMSEQSLNWARFCDLRNLYEQRGGIPVGERDKAMFWMLNFLGHARIIHSSSWESEIQALSKAFPASESFKPVTDGSMKSLHTRLKHKEQGIAYEWQGKEVSPLYRPGNQLLVDTFCIAPEEMGQLKTIISPDEKRSRADARVPGRQGRREQRNSWRQEVERIFSEQKNYRTVSKSPSENSAPGLQPSEPIVSVNVLAGKKPLNKAVRPEANECSSSVRIAELASYLGVERTRVSRYWSQLERRIAQSLQSPRAHHAAHHPESALTPTTSGLENDVPVTDAAAGSDHQLNPQGNASQALEDDQASLAVDAQCEAILEAGRLAKLAMLKAQEAQEVQARLGFERKRLLLQESWAQRQLADLAQLKPLPAIEHISSAFPTLDEVRVGNARGTCQSALTLCLMPQSCAK